jgi:hypothetical protein
VQAAGLDEDHALHRPPGEVHRPHMRLVQGTVSSFGPEPDHEAVPYHPAEHVPAKHECQPAEHLPVARDDSRPITPE